MSNDIESALSAMGYEVTSGEVPEGTPLDAPTFSAIRTQSLHPSNQRPHRRNLKNPNSN